MILSYLAQALAPGYKPTTSDRLDAERVAALRLYFWASLGVGETAVAQSLRTPDRLHRAELESLVAVLMPELRVADRDRDALAARTNELERLHSDADDCRIVAEADLIEGVTHLVTFDRRLQRRLQEEVGVRIVAPTELWAELAIPRGAKPICEPAPGNPLRQEAFWRWD